MTDDLLIRYGWEQCKQIIIIFSYLFFLAGVGFILGPWLYRKVNGKDNY